MKLRVAFTWDGQALPETEIATVECFIENGELTVLVEAPYFDDPPPAAKAGSTDGLWEHEVVELFLLGEQEHYLEIELAPRGHYLVLQLNGRRNVTRKGLFIRYESEILGKRWRGVALMPPSYLPARIQRANAYAIHGSGDHRRYSAAFPVPGPAPDFHRLEHFGRIEWPPRTVPATLPKKAEEE